MQAAIPTDLLLRLLNATPEQYAAVERALESAPALVNQPALDGLEKRCDKADEPKHIFRLGRGYKVWNLVFAGKHEVLADERAVNLVEYLLKHPPENPLHASELEIQVDGNPLLDGLGGIGQAEENGNVGVAVGSVGGVIEEATGRKLAGSDTLPALRAEVAELRSIIDDETLPAEEREEAQEKLSQLAKARARGGKFVDGSSRAADRVRKQIKTFIQELMTAEITRGKSNLILRAFGKHLEDCLWLPSVGGKNRLGATGKAGCFIYCPPNGVRWRD